MIHVGTNTGLLPYPVFFTALTLFDTDVWGDPLRFTNAPSMKLSSPDSIAVL